MLRLRVVAEDGNYDEYFVPIVIDNAEQAGPGFSSPIDGSTVKGGVQVFAVATHPEFRKWQLDLLPFGDPEQATFLAVDDAPRIRRLTGFDSRNYPNGTHQLRLRVVHSNLQYDEYFSTITIAN